MKRRRGPNVFGLAFLDAMFCGFGAVILLYMIIDHSSAARREELQQAMARDADTLRQQVEAEGLRVAAARETLDAADAEEERLRAQAQAMRSEIDTRRRELRRMDQDTVATRAHVAALKADVRALEQDTNRLEAASVENDAEGDELRRFRGDGDRQYLTGLDMGGERVLILVDTSASMLADTVVNVILRRNLPDTRKVRSGKWQRAAATVDWLTTQLPDTGRYQIYTFNTEARPALADTAGRWLETRDVRTLEAAVRAVHASVPRDGTNLHAAFSVARQLSPPPDSLYLITDGLPTQGASGTRRGKVSGSQRMKLFTEAVRALPAAIPVNVVLFFMEGDPMATSAYWKLAVATRGALVSPAEDWP